MHLDLRAQQPGNLEPVQAPAKKTVVQNPALLPVEDVAGLPRVLIIGDSISMGYTIAGACPVQG